MGSNREMKLTKIEEELFVDLFTREFELIHLREMMSSLLKSEDMELSSDPDAGLKLVKLLSLFSGSIESLERIEDFYIEATYRTRKWFSNSFTIRKAARSMVDLVAHFDWSKDLVEAFEIFEWKVLCANKAVETSFAFIEEARA